MFNNIDVRKAQGLATHSVTTRQYTEGFKTTVAPASDKQKTVLPRGDKMPNGDPPSLMLWGDEGNGR